MAKVTKFDIVDGVLSQYVKHGHILSPELASLNQKITFNRATGVITVRTIHARDVQFDTWVRTADRHDPQSYYTLSQTHFTTHGGKAIVAGNAMAEAGIAGVTFDGTIHADHFFGTTGDDHIFGYDNDDELHGGSGDDHIDGGTGNDIIYGDDGCDVLVGNTGDDVLHGGMGDDLVQGNEGNDVLFSDAGNDMLDGGTGDDVLYGGDGKDTLIGFTGNDALDGGGGNDMLDAGTGDDALDGGDGNDTLVGFTGNDVLDGGSGNDKLDAGTGDDVLDGGAGDDRLDGGAGIDVLIGGPGADILTGGSHMDRFVFREGDMGGTTSATADHITDFSHIDGDRIDLSDVDANALRSGVQHFVFIGSETFDHIAGELRVGRLGSATVLQADTDGDGRADFAVFIDNHLDAVLSRADLIL